MSRSREPWREGMVEAGNVQGPEGCEDGGGEWS